MKFIFQWDKDKQPDINKWVVFDPKKVAYVDDPFLKEYNELIKSDYLNTRARRMLLLHGVESLFYTMTFIDRIENGHYYLKCLVRLKTPESLDFEVSFKDTEEQFMEAVKVNGPDNSIMLTDVVQREQVTSDPAVEYIFYPKEIYETIESC